MLPALRRKRGSANGLHSQIECRRSSRGQSHRCRKMRHFSCRIENLRLNEVAVIRFESALREVHLVGHGKRRRTELDLKQRVAGRLAVLDHQDDFGASRQPGRRTGDFACQVVGALGHRLGLEGFGRLCGVRGLSGCRFRRCAWRGGGRSRWLSRARLDPTGGGARRGLLDGRQRHLTDLGLGA